MKTTRTRIIPATAEREVAEEVTVCDCCKKAKDWAGVCVCCGRDVCLQCSGEFFQPLAGRYCYECRALRRLLMSQLGQLKQKYGEAVAAVWAEWKAKSLATEPKPEKGG